MNPERTGISKVPEITIYFWIIKILTTGMGETLSDFFIHRVGLTNKPALVAIALGTGLVLAICLLLQFRAPGYVPWTYWLAIAMVSVFGTMAADGVHVVLNVPYVVSSIFFAIVLAGCFAVWYQFEKTLSIHSITTFRREFFYWTVVMTTFALGTATGDMTAYSLHLGFLSSGLLFAALFALPALAYWKLGLNEVVAFWFAYIITRPLGASFADWFAGSTHGALAWGYGPVALVLIVFIACFVGYLTVSRKDVPKEPATIGG
jgi:uncharacterized membrane-anchored protein